MAEETLDELVERSLVSIGSLLAKQRWAKATPKDRAEQARKMLAGRKRRVRRKK